MQTSNINVTFDGRVYVGFDFAALPLGAALQAALVQVDQAADLARRTVMGDPLRALEYQLTAEEAEAFKAASYAGEVAPTVQAWMDAAGLDAQAATDNILQEASAWQNALYKIRAARLKGKQGVRMCASHASAESVADAAIAEIQTSIQGVGNAA